MVGGGGELVVRYGTSMAGRVMVIAAVVTSVANKKSCDDCCFLSFEGVWITFLNDWRRSILFVVKLVVIILRAY